MNFLFWLWLMPLWSWQNTAMRVERATLTVGNQQIACTPNQVVNVPALSVNARNHIVSVAFDLELAASEREWADLQNTRKLPVMFKWFRFSGARMFITGVTQDSNVGAARSASRVATGATVYHAHVANERITSGTWVITPIYADNTPIIVNGKELSFQFRVP